MTKLLRKSFLVLIALLIAITMTFVSCSDASGKVSDGNRTVSVKFIIGSGVKKDADEGAKLIYAEPDEEDDYTVGEMYWRYTAVMTSGTNANGSTLGETTLTDSTGLSDKVDGFAMGEWTFQLYAYKDEEFSTLLYRSKPLNVYLDQDKTLVFAMGKVQEAIYGSGILGVDVESIELADALVGETFVLEAYYYSVDKTETTSLTEEDSYTDENAEPGSHEVVLRYTYEGAYYANVIKANVYSNFKTVIKGRMDFRKLRSFTVTFKDVGDTAYSGSNLAALTAEAGVHTYTVPTLLPAGEKDYYTFENWSLDPEGNTTISDIEANVYEDVTVYAKFTPIEYTISYDYNAQVMGEEDPTLETGSNPSTYNVTSGEIAIENPTRYGCTFIGWTVGSDMDTLTTSLVIPAGSHGDRAYRANWEIVLNSVTMTDFYFPTAVVIDFVGAGLESFIPEYEGASIASNSLEFTYGSDGIDLKKEGATLKDYKIEGLYLDTSLTDKLVNADGTFVENVSNYTDADGRWIKDGGNVKLYTKWVSSEKPLLLSGEFTVNESGKKVNFSRGNLYYTGSAWGFEDYQYDFRTWQGNAAVKNGVYSSTGTANGNMGLFNWSKDTDKAVAGTYDSTGRSTSDVFFLDTTPVMGSDWFTLTYYEWGYLLNTRTYATSKKGTATINTGSYEVTGLVLLPDSWTQPSGCSFTSGYGNGYSTNSYTLSQWTDMENAGAVFFPAAGKRDGSSLYDVQSWGYYWSSTPSSGGADKAYYVYFGSDYVRANGNNYRGGAGSVRLVTLSPN